MIYLLFKWLFKNFGALVGIAGGLVFGVILGSYISRVTDYNYWWLSPAIAITAAAAIAPFTKAFFDSLFPPKK